MADIFLSYQKRDADLAQRVGSALKAEGLSVWWDDDITPRESWDRVIEREIAAADHVLVLWTRNSVESDWVRIEANYARNCQPSKLVQARFDHAAIPIAFSMIQYVDLTLDQPDRGVSWRKLVSWLEHGAATPASQPEPPSPPPPAAQVKAMPRREELVRDKPTIIAAQNWRQTPAIAGGGALILLAAVIVMVFGEDGLWPLFGRLVREFPYSPSSTFSTIYFLKSVVVACVAPLAGLVLDRYGERVPFIAAMFGMALALALLSAFPFSITIFATALLTTGVLSLFAGLLVCTRLVSAAFGKWRGAALGVVFVADGLASLLLPDLYARIAESVGTSGLCLIVGGMLLAAVLIFHLLLRAAIRPGEPAAREPAHYLGEGPAFALVVRSALFWRLALVAVLIGVGVIGLSYRFDLILSSMGYERAGWAAEIGLCTMLGSILAGLAADRISIGRFAGAVFALCAIGLVLFANTGPSLAWLGAIAVGASIGVAWVALAYLPGAYFGLQSYGRTFGALVGLSGLSALAASRLAESWWQWYHSFYQSLSLTAVLTGLAAIALVTLPRAGSAS